MIKQVKEFKFGNIRNKAAVFGGIFKTKEGIMRPTSVLHLNEKRQQSRLNVIEARPLDHDCIGLQFEGSFIEIILSDYDFVIVSVVKVEHECFLGLAFGGTLIKVSLKDIAAEDVLSHFTRHLTTIGM